MTQLLINERRET